MAKSKSQRDCFIIMPITTPTHLVEQYNYDEDHFIHVLDHLFIPAVKEVGFTPISPKATGSNIIQADIIKQLSECELVLCDMSTFNPNVFYEFGIRTALDKPVALVVDDKSKPIPFHPSTINCQEYDSSLTPWILEGEKQKLTKHIQDAYGKSKDHNALWKVFGIAQTGKFKPGDVELGEKIDLLIKKVDRIEMVKLTEVPSDKSYKTSDRINDIRYFLLNLEKEGYSVSARAEEFLLDRVSLHPAWVYDLNGKRNLSKILMANGLIKRDDE